MPNNLRVMSAATQFHTHDVQPHSPTPHPTSKTLFSFVKGANDKMWSNVRRTRSYWKTENRLAEFIDRSEARTLPVEFLLLSVSETAAPKVGRDL